MTQKELLYVEDAISHEKNIIEVLKFTSKSLEDSDLAGYIDDEIITHQDLEKELIELLEDNINE